ncbi:MAG: hypothetical protein LUF85_03865 [Bacteroides sp.]|nr:hypothetical protein [Bacteroides sp.]
MVRLILKQLWAGKRSNGWIMAMLILVTFFLWIVIDPLFVLLANKAIPQGYDTDQTCLLTISSYPSVHSRYREEESTDSAMHVNFLRILDEVRRYPGVEAATIMVGYPFSTSYNGCMIYKDTLSLHVQTMGMYRYGEYFQVFRIAEVNTGKWEGLDEKIHDPGQMIITRGIEQLFSGTECCGTDFYSGN